MPSGVPITFGGEVEQFSFRYDNNLEWFRDRTRSPPYRFHLDGSGPAEISLIVSENPKTVVDDFLRLFHGRDFPIWEAQQNTGGSVRTGPMARERGRGPGIAGYDARGCGSHLHFIPKWWEHDTPMELLAMTWNTTITLVPLTLPFFSFNATTYRDSVRSWAHPHFVRLAKQTIEHSVRPRSAEGQWSDAHGRHRGRVNHAVTWNTNRKPVTTIEFRHNEMSIAWAVLALYTYKEVLDRIMSGDYNEGRSPKISRHADVCRQIFRNFPRFNLDVGPIEFQIDRDGVERFIPGMNQRYATARDFFRHFVWVYRTRKREARELMRFYQLGYHPGDLPNDLVWNPRGTAEQMSAQSTKPPQLWPRLLKPSAQREAISELTDRGEDTKPKRRKGRKRKKIVPIDLDEIPEDDYEEDANGNRIFG